MTDTTTIVSCMRNEGIFVLEWLAYHLEIGIDRAVIATNNCTDGSDDLLDYLQTMGHVTHIRHTPAPGQAPQDSGMRAIMAQVGPQDTTWMLFIDADEFLNIRIGKGHIADLLQQAGPCDVIALAWRFFGNASLTDWPGGDVLTAFTKAETAPDPEIVNFKSMFRRAHFNHSHDHMPQEPLIEKPIVVSAAGQRLHAFVLHSPHKFRRYAPPHKSIRVDVAAINHYAVKSDDLFLMRNDRGDGQGNVSRRYHLNWKWHRLANLNEVEETSILRHATGVAARLAQWRQDPELAKREKYCQDWFHAARARILTPQTRADWTFTQGNPT